METVHDIAAARAAIRAARAAGHRIALVPTMGNLHAGHMALVDRAREAGDFVVASVFVNPLQFGPGEDLDAYPRTLPQDQQLLTEHGTALLFAPSAQAMYPDGMSGQTRVSVPELGDILCGASRPGHFDGVTTVVSKLFNILTPDVAVFGLKDYQQFTILQKMVRDLCMDIDLIGIPTARAEDGLALSSRNGYLTAEERARAPALFRTLQDTAARLQRGETAAEALAGARSALEDAGFRPDYVELRTQHDLARPAPTDRALVLLAAAHLGKARLIDNLAFRLDEARQG